MKKYVLFCLGFILSCTVNTDPVTARYTKAELTECKGNAWSALSMREQSHISHNFNDAKIKYCTITHETDGWHFKDVDDKTNKGIFIPSDPIPDYRTNAIFVMVIFEADYDSVPGQIIILVEPYQKLVFGKVI